MPPLPDGGVPDAGLTLDGAATAGADVVPTFAGVAGVGGVGAAGLAAGVLDAGVEAEAKGGCNAPPPPSGGRSG